MQEHGRSLSNSWSEDWVLRRGVVIVKLVCRVVVGLALVLTTNAVAGPGPDVPSPVPPPVHLGIFNNPLMRDSIDPQTRGGSDNAVIVPGAPSGITAEIVNVLASAAAHATVTIAMFTSSDDGLSGSSADTELIKSAIRDAAPRVRAINVLVDAGPNQTLWRSMRHVPHVAVRRCDGSCFHTGRGIMHNKFLLVDDTTWTSGREYVVVQMTANWKNVQLSSQHWNSSLQIWGDRTLYDGYLGYHRQLWRCAPRCHGAPARQDVEGKPGSGTHVYFFPRSNGDDPVLDPLFEVTACSSGDGIDIAINDWRRDRRGTAILARLEALAALGCPVRIVVEGSRKAGAMATGLPESSLATSSRCTPRGKTRTNLRTHPPMVHSKYVLIHGTFRGVPGTTVVATGSERFATRARDRDDETWLTLMSTPGQNVANAAVYAAFEANFDEMWAMTPPCPPVSPAS
ncbi:MAG: hypothetical protein QOJ03_810 [Frankiaceae bacterium]|jgi:phosphatidylserine/phosphatidylglycerophosphate/cardiolipin synthase-like enzyme|nr:hypothetical protein [Frankiaceae bacterium]